MATSRAIGATVQITLLICLGFLFFFWGVRALEIFLFIYYIYLSVLLLRWLVKRFRRQRSRGSDDADHPDLRRFRERMAERGREGGVRESSSQTDGVDDTGAEEVTDAQRRELVGKCLFTRTIQREESVRELALLLAASRGGGGDIVDEELGTAGSEKPGADSEPEETMTTTARTAGPSLVAPSAPVPEAVADAANPRRDPPASPENDTVVIGTIRGLWNSLAPIPPSVEGDAAAVTPAQSSDQIDNNADNIPSARKLECPICLEAYSPGDVIAWAKDGGDASTDARGCEHVFHEGCLSAWLEEHDECPLCRRKVIHPDASVRFAGWETMAG